MPGRSDTRVFAAGRGGKGATTRRTMSNEQIAPAGPGRNGCTRRRENADNSRRERCRREEKSAPPRNTGRPERTVDNGGWIRYRSPPEDSGMVTRGTLLALALGVAV